jgi:hypothetical protein
MMLTEGSAHKVWKGQGAKEKDHSTWEGQSQNGLIIKPALLQNKLCFLLIHELIFNALSRDQEMHFSQAWCYMPVIPAFRDGGRRIVNSRQGWDTQ